MKRTKIITVDVCDKCGAESHRAVVCNICKLEACDRCMSWMHIQVRRASPSQTGTSIAMVHVRHNCRCCMECSTKIVKTLRELGLIETVANDVQGVLD